MAVQRQPRGRRAAGGTRALSRELRERFRRRHHRIDCEARLDQRRHHRARYRIVWRRAVRQTPRDDTSVPRKPAVATDSFEIRATVAVRQTGIALQPVHGRDMESAGTGPHARQIVPSRSTVLSGPSSIPVTARMAAQRRRRRDPKWSSWGWLDVVRRRINKILTLVSRH